MSTLNAERLRNILSYAPETGEFRWLISPRANVMAGAVAGSIVANGYRRIKIGGRRYYAQRLAWLYMTGEWPAEQVDHKNLIKDDNSWKNLRQASHTENMRNVQKRRDNVSGFRGVSWDKGCSKWRAHIQVNKRLIYLGIFADIDTAAAAYAAASEKYHGEFGRLA